MIPVIFYIVVAAARLDIPTLRRTGWLFDMGDAAEEKWYKFYSYYGWSPRYLYSPLTVLRADLSLLDINLIQMGAIWATIPTQLAL